MNKISIIEIQNFQIHDKLRLHLKDFNIITGKSSSGKSAIFRALRFLLYGEWDSTYPKDQSKASGVAIVLNNGVKIIRVRKGSTNSAAIKITPDEVIQYKSFGLIIPELDKYIFIPNIKIMDKTINLNFSMQEDPLFLVAESRTFRAQMFNRLSGIHIVTKMLKSMNTDLRNKEAKLKDLNEQIDILKNNKILSIDIDKQEHEYQNVKTKIKTLKTLSELNNKIIVLDLKKKEIEQLKILKYDFKGIKNCLEKLSILSKIQERMIKLEQQKTDVNKYKKLIKLDISKIKQKINRLNNCLILQEKIEKYCVKKENIVKYDKILKVNFSNVKQKMDVLNKMKEWYRKLRLVENNKIIVLDDKQKNEIKIIALIEQYNKLLEENKVCPVCHSKISTKHYLVFKNGKIIREKEVKK